MDHSRHQLQMTVYASLFAALISVGSYIAIPVGPIPVVLQNFFVLLAGLLLGKRWGTASVGIFLLAGILGLPVFAGGTGGIGRFAGPTGGYLVSYIPAAFVAGLAAGAQGKKRIVSEVAALVCASLLVYVIGVPWLKFMTGMGWDKAMAAGMIPFLPGDVFKIIAAVPVAASLRPLIEGRFSPVPAHGCSQG